MNIKPIIASLLVLFLWSCGGVEIDGKGCEPKWWNEDMSTGSTLYGYGRDSSEEASFAAMGSLGDAQRHILQQLNNLIAADYNKRIKDLEAKSGKEFEESFIKNQQAGLSFDINATCTGCTQVATAECNSGGEKMVYTKVVLNDADDYLEQEVSAKMDRLIKEADALISD